MFKSKLFLKAMFVVSSAIFMYTLAIYIFVIPKVSNNISSLEEKNAHDSLSKVVTIVQNFNNDLKSYEKLALKKHKSELKNLTDTVWSIIQAKYEKSKPQNIGDLLKIRAENFNRNLTRFYNLNKDSMSKKELKKAISTYIRIYRYDNGIGYFFVNNLNSKSVIHPLKPEVEGKSFKNIKDSDGIYYVNKMVNIVKEKGAGTLRYRWENPKTHKIEEKISYVFIFKPFNWIIGTGEYYSVLNKKLQDEVIELVSKLSYAKNNYFYISDYNNVLISHPYLQNKNMSDIRDIKGSLIVPPMVEIARKKGAGFYTYWWKKNKKDNTPYKKLTFSKNFVNWKIVIGTGVYIDEIEDEISKRKIQLMNQLRGIVQTTKIGKTGYLYIFDGKANMLIHPNSNINGKNFLKVKNPTKGSYIFDDLVKASKTTNELFYKWDNPKDRGNYIYNKVSWIKYIPDLDWYIVSSAYVDEFKESSNNIKYFIFSVAFLILIVSALYSFFFFKNLLTPVINLSKHAAMGEMISIIAHQWRQPLNELGLVLQKFEFSYKRGFLTQELIENETKTGKKLIAKMTNTIDIFKNFLDLRKETQIFDIVSSLKNVVMLVEETCKINKVKIILEIKSSKDINSFQGEFEHAILNIVNNAIDVLGEKKIDEKIIKIKTSQFHDKLIIDICDSGGGIQEDIIFRVFNPHFTTKKDGVGIGLYIAKQIIFEHMQGDLTVANETFMLQSKKYYGACFKVKI